MTYYTVVRFTYGMRMVGSYETRAAARGQRTACARRLKGKDVIPDVRILRTEIAEDGEVFSDWIE